MATKSPVDTPKTPTRFDKFMSDLGKTTGKLKKQASKVVVNGKIRMQNKINNVQSTSEDEEMLIALEKLKTTKNEITSLTENMRVLYTHYAAYMRQSSLISSELSKTKVDQNDNFGAYCKSFGETLSYIDGSRTDYAKKMLENYIVPMEKFRDTDVDEAQTMKLKYKTLKSNYDIAAASLKKANENYDHNKIASAQGKYDECKNELDAFRLVFKSKLASLEAKRQNELLILIQEYWKTYESYINNLSKTIATKPPFVNKDYYNTGSNPEINNIQEQKQEQDSDNNNNNNNNVNINNNNYDNNNYNTVDYLTNEDNNNNNGEYDDNNMHYYREQQQQQEQDYNYNQHNDNTTSSPLYQQVSNSNPFD